MQGYLVQGAESGGWSPGSLLAGGASRLIEYETDVEASADGGTRAV